MTINHLMSIFEPGDESYSLSTNFKAGEFKCKRRNCPWFVSMDLLCYLQDMRTKAGVPFRINSAYRTPLHNRLISGAKRSKHMSGMAVDIAIPRGMTNYDLAGLAYTYGIRRIGVAKSFVHIDIGDGETYWGYGSTSKPGIAQRIIDTAKNWS